MSTHSATLFPSSRLFTYPSISFSNSPSYTAPLFYHRQVPNQFPSHPLLPNHQFIICHHCITNKNRILISSYVTNTHSNVPHLLRSTFLLSKTKPITLATPFTQTTLQPHIPSTTQFSAIQPHTLTAQPSTTQPFNPIMDCINHTVLQHTVLQPHSHSTTKIFHR